MSIPSKVKNFIQAMIKPSPSTVLAAVKTMKPHVPLIKFRKVSANQGGRIVSTPASPAMSVAPPRTAKSVASSPAKPNATISLPQIEDWQLPQRYRRRPLDPIEVDFINRGGPE